MTLSYGTQNSSFNADQSPEEVRAQYHRSISGGLMNLDIVLSFACNGDTQTDAAYLGWIEDVTAALNAAGWTRDNLVQYSPSKASREIS